MRRRIHFQNTTHQAGALAQSGHRGYAARGLVAIPTPVPGLRALGLRQAGHRPGAQGGTLTMMAAGASSVKRRVMQARTAT